jgi:hypothetical protein
MSCQQQQHDGYPIVLPGRLPLPHSPAALWHGSSARSREPWCPSRVAEPSCQPAKHQLQSSFPQAWLPQACFRLSSIQSGAGGTRQLVAICQVHTGRLPQGAVDPLHLIGLRASVRAACRLCCRPPPTAPRHRRWLHRWRPAGLESHPRRQPTVIQVGTAGPGGARF